MEPGYGAEQQASRRARRLAEKRREVEATGATQEQVAAALKAEQQRMRAWSAGAEGERLVAAALDTLSPYGWTALHDVHWPGRPLANVDHIAIGPGGVVVVDAKNWSGDVRLHGGQLRQNGYRRDREVQNVAVMTAEITALLAPQHRSAVVGAICLAAQDQDLHWTPDGVAVVGRLQLASALAALPHRLTPYDVADIGRFLAERLGAPQRSPRQRRAPSSRSRGTGSPQPLRYAPPPRPKPARSTRRRGTRRGPGATLASGLLRLGVLALGAWLFIQWIPTLAERM